MGWCSGPEVLMATTAAGRKVEAGLWWNLGTLEVRSIPPAGGLLPEAGSAWHRIPAWIYLPLAPVVGGLFVVALPIAGAGLLAGAALRRLLSGGRHAVLDLSHVLVAPHAVGAAHLAGSPGQGKAAAGQADGLDELEEQIKARQAMEEKSP
jgi:hypothetical protein